MSPIDGACYRVVAPHETPAPGWVRVPMVGRSVSAGFPSPADDFAEGAIELPRWLCPNPAATFLWRVAGRSAIGAGVFDGDLAVIDRSRTPVSGNMVLAMIDGEPTLKRYRIEGNRAVLSFENVDLPAFALEEASEVAIWGVLAFSIRLHCPLPRGS